MGSSKPHIQFPEQLQQQHTVLFTVYIPRPVAVSRLADNGHGSGPVGSGEEGGRGEGHRSGVLANVSNDGRRREYERGKGHAGGEVMGGGGAGEAGWVLVEGGEVSD